MLLYKPYRYPKFSAYCNRVKKFPKRTQKHVQYYCIDVTWSINGCSTNLFEEDGDEYGIRQAAAASKIIELEFLGFH